jgi:hypothetical protein
MTKNNKMKKYKKIQKIRGKFVDASAQFYFIYIAKGNPKDRLRSGYF